MDKPSSGRSFLFWQKWLFCSSLLFALYGVVFAFCENNVLLLSYDKMLARILWHREQFPPEAEPFRMFIYGPLGGTIACCYILLAFIAWYPFREKRVWARNAIVFAFGVWVVIDSALCFCFGVYPQIILINGFSILVKALPLIFTWKD
ncbi:MAG TPA: hypothetical protein VGO45_07100, partial [Bacteroidia bacterium]|nr:hypothetical protein [Bacteroidia bacterium]